MIRKPVTIQNNMDMEDRRWLILYRKQASTRARYTF